MDELLAIPGTRREGCSQMSLLRLRAGELEALAAAAVRGHLGGCDRCRREMERLDKEEVAYRRDESAEKFRAAVMEMQGQVERRRWAGPVALAIAATLVGALAIGPVRDAMKLPRGNGLKGTGPSAMELYVGGVGASPRVALPQEPLKPGERIRVALRAPSEADRYVVVFSVDEAGTATALYPESGVSMPSDPTAGSHLMPDSVELTGRGLEKVIAVFSKEPLQVEAVLESARQELKRAGSLAAMKELPLGGVESSQILRKP